MPTAPRRPLAAGAARLFALRVWRLASSALLTLVVARLLGPAGSGTFALALALFAVLAQLATAGIEVGVVWLVGGGRWSARSALVTTQVAAGALGLAWAAAGLAALVPLGDRGVSAGVAAPVLAAVPFHLAWTFASQIALALERYEAASRIPAVQALVSVSAVALLAAVLGLPGATLGLLASQVAAAAVAAVWARRLPAQPGEGPLLDLRRLREAARFGSRPYAANLLTTLKYRADFFVLAAYAPSRAVGYYALATALITTLRTLPNAMAAAVFPRVTTLTAIGDAAAARRDEVETRAMRHAVLLTLAASAGLVVVVTAALEPIFGRGFAPARDLTLLLLPGGAALGLSAVVAGALAGRGHPELSLRTALLTTPPTIALYFLAIPPLGAVGAALASTGGYVLTAVLTLRFFRRVTGRPVLARLVPGAGELRDLRALAGRLRRRGAPG